jgi:hypothetical protein
LRVPVTVLGGFQVGPESKGRRGYTSYELALNFCSLALCFFDIVPGPVLLRHDQRRVVLRIETTADGEFQKLEFGRYEMESGKKAQELENKQSQ